MGTKKAPAEEAQVDAEVRPESEQPTQEASGAGEPAATAPTAPAPPEKFSPRELARKLGHLGKPSGLKVSNRDSKDPVARADRYSFAHAAAAQLHGWNAHDLHTAEPLRLTREDYEAALAAALNPVTPTDMDGKPTGAPKYRPHEAALSPFCPRGNAR